MLLSCAASAASAKTWTCELHPKYPVLLEGCDGEACGVLTYERALSDTPLYAAPSDELKKVGDLRRCERISSFATFTRLKRPGVAEVVEPDSKAKALGVRVGDKIPLLRSHGEGFSSGCIGKTTIDFVDTYAGNADTETRIKVAAWPDSETWTRVKNQKGVVGYSNKHDFYMGYYSYEPSLFCAGDHPLGIDADETLRKVGEVLGNSFEKNCVNMVDCRNAKDPTSQCKVETAVWLDILPLFPKSVQCAAFILPEKGCEETWQGTFTCAFKHNGKDRHANFSYQCQKTSGKVACRVT